MQFFLSPSFYAAVAALWAVLLLLARSGRGDERARETASHASLLAANLALVATLFPGEPWKVAMLLAWVGAVFLVARATAASSGAALARTLNTAAIVGAVLVLAALKYPALAQLLAGAPVRTAAWRPSGASAPLTGFAGVSYFTLRFIQVLVDARKGRLADFTLLRYTNFVLFFPTFLSGPLQRYAQFQIRQADGLAADRIAAGLVRIAVGLVKKLLLAGLALSYAITEFPPGSLAQLGWWAVLASIYAYGLYIYLDFSGYCDMAIGTAALLGVDVPENFRYPFLSRNIQEFWTRWHITLAAWLRDYVYYPLSVALMRATGLRSGPAIPALGILLTFVVMGLWHGESRACLLYGLWHGAGLAGFKLFDELLRRRLKRLNAWMERSRVWRVVAIGLTLHFFLAGLAIFSGHLGGLLAPPVDLIAPAAAAGAARP